MSRISIPLEDRFTSEAEFGLFCAYEKITHKKAIELQKEGFIVTDSHESRAFPRIHRIYWGQAVVECEDVHSLNENDLQYSMPQKFWIIAMKNQPEA